MKNTTKNAILAAVRNVDDATYEKTIKWWANDAIGSFGEYLLKIWSNYYNMAIYYKYCSINFIFCNGNYGMCYKNRIKEKTFK